MLCKVPAKLTYLLDINAKKLIDIDSNKIAWIAVIGLIGLLYLK